MKKIFILLAACLFLLSGCNNIPSANLSPQNSNESGAVNAATATPSESGGSVTGSHPDVPVAATSGKVLEIKEKMFIAQTNDIYYNAEDYLGKTIKYEGIFDVYEVPETGMAYYSVIRYGPGCCGIDANAGFEVKWDNEYPKPDDWCEVIGVLEEYEEDGYQYLRLILSELNVLDVRGAEYVSQ
jgi:uncharacterized membrane protein YcgQ (UPF0703/DUF1980 family)